MNEELSPELLKWANKQLNLEEIMDGIREIQELGGYELHEFIHELEQESLPTIKS